MTNSPKPDWPVLFLPPEVIAELEHDEEAYLAALDAALSNHLRSPATTMPVTPRRRRRWNDCPQGAEARTALAELHLLIDAARMLNPHRRRARFSTGWPLLMPTPWRGCQRSPAERARGLEPIDLPWVPRDR